MDETVNTRVLRVYLSDGDSVVADPEQIQRIDAAVTSYLDSACTKDFVVDINWGQSTIWTPVSNIVCWSIESSVTRKEVVRLNKALEDEASEIRHEMGMWDEA